MFKFIVFVIHHSTEWSLAEIAQQYLYRKAHCLSDPLTHHHPLGMSFVSDKFLTEHDPKSMHVF